MNIMKVTTDIYIYIVLGVKLKPLFLIKINNTETYCYTYGVRHIDWKACYVYCLHTCKVFN